MFFDTIDLSRSFVLLEKNGTVTCRQGALHRLAKLADIHALARRSGHDVVFALPYRVIKERGFEARGDEPILALEAEVTLTLPVQRMAEELPEKEIVLESEVVSSLDDQEYAELVRRFQENEIEAGNASQTTLSRCFSGQIKGFDLQTALAIYRKAIRQRGQYMTVLFANIDPAVEAGGQYIIGATPERHLEIRGNETIMMPIAGTLRKENRRDFPRRLENFLKDPKEINELFQVVDEEMKMMGVICPEGGEIEGPFLHEIGAVVHTEYQLVGRRSTDTIAALRRTLHAPTVVGSPMESAARIIRKYEKESRRYYAGEIGIYHCPRTEAPNGDLDSAILIRCAEIDEKGRFRVQAGGGLVRDSDPANEARESRAKALGILGFLSGTSQLRETYLTEELRRKSAPLLSRRNTHLSAFWTNRQNPYMADVPSLSGLRATVLNNEDDFAHMIGHMLRLMHAEVAVMDSFDFDPKRDASDVMIIGPGPGDPTDMSHPRMSLLQKIIGGLSARRRPILGICLGHQALAVHENIRVERQRESTQGLQRTVEVGGEGYRLGFYNSFSPVFDAAARARKDLQFDVDDSQRIIAMRGARCVGFQFHPESIMSERGAELLHGALMRLRPRKSRAL